MNATNHVTEFCESPVVFCVRAFHPYFFLMHVEHFVSHDPEGTICPPTTVRTNSNLMLLFAAPPAPSFMISGGIV